MQEDDLAFLSQEFREILGKAEQIKAAYKQQPRMLIYLWGIVGDLYNDRAKMKGLHNVQSKMPMLKNILNNYSLEDLKQFFAKI